METNNPTHILVIPYPAQGHLIPMIDLTHHLASTGHVTLTVVITPKNLSSLSPLLSSHPSSVFPLVLPFPATSDIPSGAENTMDLPPASFRPVMYALAQFEHPLRRWFDSHPSPPVAIISDFFLGWTHRFASQLGIKRVVFSPSGAFALSVIYSLWRDMPKPDQNGDVLFPDVPNSPKYPSWQLSPIYRSYVEGEVVSEFIKAGFRDDVASWGLVINSFHELERDYLSHLMSMVGHDRVWAVGPLVPDGPNLNMGRGGSSSVEADKIFSWLDTCQDGEVVYVAFGTQATLTNQQMEVVAKGLENSGVRFIWSVRDPTMTQHGEVPVGFVDRMAGRGVVIKGWAPQVPILNHSAVGAFLTHCGWNSVLEGLMAGVRLLAWPMGADQFSNATLLVDHLKVGVKVSEGSGSVPDPIELARLLADSVSRERIDGQRITKLHNAALEAMNGNGSSYKELIRLVKTLGELKM